ncbi:hypothetical protein DCC39_00940 [Pueribacillus theae]|uniref:Type III secretion system protein n=1 Tax=Pueribacillus theae TaxID=2171751 RepID=A0A2U1K8J6_9BACI|nr:EscU/YscU/HrcU family type III secretion system export apparatus switch protein [Pueribacillus theae]PWA13488.1 hypothetical protein DCC39_00940 [Pueribacillus theae]
MSKNNYRKKAAALSYDSSDHAAPKLIAKGSGEIAEKIIEMAESNHIPIQQDPTLVQLLHELEINETIPEDLYKAVAEIFAFIYKLEKETD